jgi:mannosylglycerate hydrolase
MNEHSPLQGKLMTHTLYIVSHTHWDREWYVPFQEFRVRLVKLMDKLLDLLAKDEGYQHFTLDGQTIILEDYLAIRPERRKELERHVQDDRILIGPWYVLADEFLVSPEALIRNLMLGHRLAQEFGTVMKVGYTPDPFGHVSQLPQILQGFGIETAVLQRGLGDEDTELSWQAPDGSEVLLLYLRDKYDNAAHLSVADHKALLETFRHLKESLSPHAATECLLLMNGTDHMEPQPGLPKALERARGELGEDKIIHGTLPSYIRLVREALGDRQLPRVYGELRNPKRHHLLPGVLSTRVYLKQRNTHCQTLLEKWAEPFAAFAQLIQPSASDLQAQIDRSWRHLLENHAHDSICGCSVDQVHREMITRFDRSEQIAGAVTEESLQIIASNIHTSSGAEDPGSSIAVIVFNPLAGPRTDVVELTGRLPHALEQFVVEDAKGQRTPHQIVEEGQKSTLLFLAQHVPGHGYKTFFIRPSKGGEQGRNGLQSGIENDHYSVEVESAHGTLTITDKATGTIFMGLNRFVDGGDRGDEYNYCVPADDTLVSAPSVPPDIAITEAGPVRQSLEIRLRYHLPVGLAENRAMRSRDRVEVPITSRISMYPQVRRIEIQTTVTNAAPDHRLRVHFPTPWRVRSSFAESAFDVVERPIALPPDTAGWMEQPVPTHPQATFVDLSDGGKGLMVANKGLPEYEALQEAGGTTIALTLLRCVGWLSRDDLSCRRGHAGPELETPEAQCLGTHSFAYALIPHTGDWRNAYRQAHAFNAPLRGVITDLHEGPLPSEGSFVRISPPSLVISAIKVAEEGEGLILRFYNAEEHEVQAEVCLYKTFRKVILVDLNEEQLREITVDGKRTVSLPVRGKEIITMRFEFNG